MLHGTRRMVGTCALAILAACGHGEPERSTPAEAPNPLLFPRRLTDTAPERFRVHLETSEGEVVVDIHRAWSPNGVDRVYNLVTHGFYDDLRIYRVLDGFVAQFGIHGDPLVTAQWRNSIIVDDPVVESNTRGRVSFAKAGPSSRTTELIINYRDNPALDEQGFSPIGEVVEGMDVVDRFHGGYGDGPPRGTGPYSARIRALGNDYLDAEFPELTRIVRAWVEESGAGSQEDDRGQA
jgi:peptidyl-prolyl cis-trans isomerase A (cyclophilin A)